MQSVRGNNKGIRSYAYALRLPKLALLHSIKSRTSRSRLLLGYWDG